VPTLVRMRFFVYLIAKCDPACWQPRSMPGGVKGDRTPDLGIANAALSQLSYHPEVSAVYGIRQSIMRQARFDIPRNACLPDADEGFNCSILRVSS
jgi:hypothetical protein